LKGPVCVSQIKVKNSLVQFLKVVCVVSFDNINNYYIALIN
jgi:hypothetical protein